MENGNHSKPICYNCFQEKDTEGPCPHCGFDLAENEKKYPVALRAGTVLNNRYIIGRVLGQGGFGITYLALDTQLNAKVAVKEFMPGELATRVEGTTVSVLAESKTEAFTYGAERFQEEARTLAKFMGNPNIAGVSSYFDENGTSYFVMDYIEGISFKTYIANHGGKVSVDDALNVMIPVLRALTAVHAEGFIHRDVTPDNIYITKDGMVKLLDFGSARYSIGDKSKSLDVILKVGYAPKEQYIRRSRQGPYTDVYSCAACFYAALTGFLPPESLERLDNDTLVPVSQCGVDIPEYLDKAILKGLAVQPEDRFQSAAEFLDAIERQQVVEVPGEDTSALARLNRWLEGLFARARQKPLIAGGAAAALLLAALLAVGAGGGGGAGPDREPERTPPQQQEQVPTVLLNGQQYTAYDTIVNLSGQGIDDAALQELLPGLLELSALQELDLSGNAITDLTPLARLTGLERLDLSENAIADLSPLSGLTSLRWLDVGENPYVADLSPLADLTGLTELGLRDIPLGDLSFLSGMEDLQSLELENLSSGMDLSVLAGLTGVTDLRIAAGSNSVIADLSFLSGLTDLETCAISGVFQDLALPDLGGLAHLKQLRLSAADASSGTLDLAGIQNAAGLTDLSVQAYSSALSAVALPPLAELSALQNLEIRGPISDLDFLAGAAGPQTLFLDGSNASGNRLTDLAGLAGLAGVRELTLAAGEAGDFSPLSGLTGLTELSLTTRSPITSLSFVSGLTDLRRLSVNSYDVTLSDFSDLAGLTRLESLTLYPRGVTSLTGLECLTDLRELNLSGDGSYPDLDPLAGLHSLETISLPHNETVPYDTSGLAGLTKVKDLSLSGTVANLDGLATMTGLESLSISSVYPDYPALDLSPLASLTGLKRLYLNCNVIGDDITPLGKMTGLETLDINIGQGLRDLSPLAALPHLASLSVTGTDDKIDTSPVDHVPDLRVGDGF